MNQWGTDTVSLWTLAFLICLLHKLVLKIITENLLLIHTDVLNSVFLKNFTLCIGPEIGSSLLDWLD